MGDRLEDFATRLKLFSPGLRPALVALAARRLAAFPGRQIPAYHAYPPSGEAEPRPLPNPLRLSVTVMLARYLTLL